MKYGTVDVSFKTPDAADYAAKDRAECLAEENEPNGGWNSGDLAEFVEEHTQEIKEKLEKWIQYGECITISFDLDRGEASV